MPDDFQGIAIKKNSKFVSLYMKRNFKRKKVAY